MKKLLFSLLTIVAMATTQTFAQVAVTDPTQTAVNKAGWVESLAKAKAQIETLNEQKNLLTQSIELYTKVSNTIKNAATVKNIIDRQVNIVTLANEAFSIKPENIADVEVYKKYTNSIETYIDESNNIVDLLKTVISQEVKMTDGERLKILMDVDTKSQKILSKIKNRNKRFNSLNNDIKSLKSLTK